MDTKAYDSIPYYPRRRIRYKILQQFMQQRNDSQDTTAKRITRLVSRYLGSNKLIAINGTNHATSDLVELMLRKLHRQVKVSSFDPGLIAGIIEAQLKCDYHIELIIHAFDCEKGRAILDAYNVKVDSIRLSRFMAGLHGSIGSTIRFEDNQMSVQHHDPAVDDIFDEYQMFRSRCMVSKTERDTSSEEETDSDTASSKTMEVTRSSTPGSVKALLVPLVVDVLGMDDEKEFELLAIVEWKDSPQNIEEFDKQIRKHLSTENQLYQLSSPYLTFLSTREQLKLTTTAKLQRWLEDGGKKIYLKAPMAAVDGYVGNARGHYFTAPQIRSNEDD